MPAKDTYHETVKNALIKDGWTIVADPYTIKYEELQLFADLFAERVVEAQRDGQQIIVEIKSFISRSAMYDFELTLGQYIVYRTLLKTILPESKIYLGIGQEIYQSFFTQKAIQLVIQENNILLIVINLNQEEIVQWIS